MRKCTYDWAAVQTYHDEGYGFAECPQRFGFGHSAWIKAIKRGDLRAAPARDRRRKYDWAEVQAYYDEGNSFCATAAHFGFCSAAWYKAIQRREIRTRPFGMALDQLLRLGKGRWNIKHRLIQAGLLSNRCAECGISEWRGKPLTVHIDHINGVKNDNRLENLRMLCPNCHSQTETYSGHNAKRRQRLQDLASVM